MFLLIRIFKNTVLKKISNHKLKYKIKQADNRQNGDELMIDLTQNTITLSQTYPKVNDSFFIEGDVIIPDIKPDVESVLFIDAVPVVNDYSVNSGQITFSGNCEFNILYVPEELPNEIIRISTSIPFKNTFAAKNLTSDSCVTLTVTPQKVSSLILNGRKLSVSAELNACLKYSNKNKINYVDTVGNNDTTKTLCTQKVVPTFLCSNTNKSVLKDTAMLKTENPSIKDIVKYECNMENDEAVISDNKIIVKSDFSIKIYYTSDSTSEICNFKTTIPFTTFIDVNGIKENDICEITNNIKNTSLKLLPDSDELMRVIEIDTEIETNLKVSENSEINIIEDVYDTNKNLLPQRDEIYYETNSSLKQEELSQRASLTIPENSEIQILSSFARVKNINLNKENNNNLLTGLIDVTILYKVPTTGKINSISLDIPIEHILSNNIDILENIKISNFEITHLNDDNYDIKITLSASGYETLSGNISLLRDVIEMEETPIKNTGITIYFAKPGDTLWKIAKRFYTTIEKLSETNNLQNPDILDVGKALIIA